MDWVRLQSRACGALCEVPWYLGVCRLCLYVLRGRHSDSIPRYTNKIPGYIFHGCNLNSRDFCLLSKIFNMCISGRLILLNRSKARRKHTFSHFQISVVTHRRWWTCRVLRLLTPSTFVHAPDGSNAFATVSSSSNNNAANSCNCRGMMICPLRNEREKRSMFWFVGSSIFWSSRLKFFVTFINKNVQFVKFLAKCTRIEQNRAEWGHACASYPAISMVSTLAKLGPDLK